MAVKIDAACALVPAILAVARAAAFGAVALCAVAQAAAFRNQLALLEDAIAETDRSFRAKEKYALCLVWGAGGGGAWGCFGAMWTHGAHMGTSGPKSP